MSSLTEAAYYTRRSINWAILALIAYIILRIFWSILVSLAIFLFPAKPLPPDHAFGKLPVLSFPAEESSPSAGFSMRLETITGSLPNASDSARVYFMPKAAANLLAITRTEDFAKKLKFDSAPFEESKTVYRFDDSTTSLRKLRYDIVSNNFILRYAYEQDTGVFSEGAITDPDNSIDEAKTFLKSNGLMNSDLEQGSQTTTFLKLVGNTLVPVPNISEANALKVNFFRGSVNKFKLMTPNPSDGQVSMLFSGSASDKKRILELIYTFWPIDYQHFATYPLKPVTLAWQELQQGKGYIAQFPTNGDTTGVIRNVYLAFYDSFTPQTFLQPIYVFDGDYNFEAFVPAIDPLWTE